MLAHMPPSPLGFSALGLLRQRGTGRSSVKRTARSAVGKAPVGARVPSLESPILRGSKGAISRFRFPGGV